MISAGGEKNSLIFVVKSGRHAKINEAYRRNVGMVGYLMETHSLIQLCVHGHNKDDGGMWAAQRSQKQEASEVGMI